jgi:predicted phosphoribosyltransferase
VSLFRDRVEAGQAVARHVEHLRDANPYVLALPCGGVPVAFQIATSLGVPLEVIVARRIVVPTHPRVELGAISEEGAEWIDARRVESEGVSASELEATLTAERFELSRRMRLYRGRRALPDVRGRTVLLVDDGLGSPGPARAAARAIRARGPERIVFAAPVCATEASGAIVADVDDVVCAATPIGFGGLGRHYDDDSETNDRDVLRLLERARAAIGAPALSFDDDTTRPLRIRPTR